MPTEINQWIRFTIQVCLIPFCVYIVYSLNTVSQQIDLQHTQIALIEQQLNIRTKDRDAQIADINSQINDHEARIRDIEHTNRVK